MKLVIKIILQLLLISVAIYIYASLTSTPVETQIRESITKTMIENQSFLIKRELFLESIVKKEEKGTFWGTDKKALIVVKGKVPYGIDFKSFQVNDLAIDSENKTIQLTLPAPSIYDVIVSNIYVYDVQTGVFSNKEDYLKKIYQDGYSEAKKTLLEEAKAQVWQSFLPMVQHFTTLPKVEQKQERIIRIGISTAGKPMKLVFH
jgi:hypothetical protein